MIILIAEQVVCNSFIFFFFFLPLFSLKIQTNLSCTEVMEEKKRLEQEIGSVNALKQFCCSAY